MKHSDAHSNPNLEQARKRREEAQKLNIQKQALLIAQQRELAARKKSAEASGKSGPAAQPKPLSARSVYSPPPAQPAPLPKQIVAAVIASTPQPAVPKTVKAHVPRKSGRRPKPAEPAPPLDVNDVRAEMQEFAHETAKVPPQAAPEVPAEPEIPISADDIVIESPAVDEMPLKMATGESDLAREMNSVEIISSAISNPPALSKAETLKLKMMQDANFACPKCQSPIPEGQRGAFYTECRRCGEIIKMNAA